MLPVHREQLVPKDKLAMLVCQGNRVPLVQLVRQEVKGSLEALVLRELLEHLDSREAQEVQDRQVLLARRVLLAIKVLLASLVRRAAQVPADRLVLRDSLAV